MKVARYVGGGQISIVDEPIPACPEAGLLIKTEACGLCSGELMDWYMDQKIPHVFGHEVAGIVVESKDERFPVGSRVFPHHHAPCLSCDLCSAGLYVHCPQWKRTKLVPGGMAEFFGVPAGNLNDTILVDDLRPEEAALIEPLACVMKSVRAVQWGYLAKQSAPIAIVGLGVMGLLHALVLRERQPVGFDLNESRIGHAKKIGIDARPNDPEFRAGLIFVCPGSQAAFDYAQQIALPGATIVMFAPVPPSQSLLVSQPTYFRDITITHSYSCGPDDTQAAAVLLREGAIKADQVVSHFIEMSALPEAYGCMKRGEILKPMVIFHDQP